MSNPEGEQTVVYHVYQHGYVGGQGAHFSVNNFPVAYYLRPVLLFLQWALWVVYIAGAAKIQQTCNSDGATYLTSQGTQVFFTPFGPLLGFNYIENWSVSDCSTYYSQLWWSVFLQFGSVLGSTILWIALFWDITSFAKTIMYFHLMSSVLMFGIAYVFTSGVYLIYKGYTSFPNDYKNACYLICAGAIGNLVCNFFYIIWMSWEPNPIPPIPPTPAPPLEDVTAEAK